MNGILVIKSENKKIQRQRNRLSCAVGQRQIQDFLPNHLFYELDEKKLYTIQMTTVVWQIEKIQSNMASCSPSAQKRRIN